MILGHPPIRLALILLMLSAAIGDVCANPANHKNLALSNEAQAAVIAGIELSFTSNYAILRQWGPITTTAGEQKHHFLLLRHALSKRYIVKVDGQDTPNIFRSVGEAVNFISSQARMKLEFYSSRSPEYAMRIALNKFELPAPLRLKAFLSTSWDIDTGWIRWASVN